MLTTSRLYDALHDDLGQVPEQWKDIRWDGIGSRWRLYSNGRLGNIIASQLDLTRTHPHYPNGNGSKKMSVYLLPKLDFSFADFCQSVKTEN